MGTRDRMYSEFPFVNSLCVGNLALEPPRDGGILRYGLESSF